MAKGRYEVVGRLPPGQGGKTLLALMSGAPAFRRLAVLRPVGDAMLIPVGNVHPQLPAPHGVEEIDGTSCAIYDFFPGATLKEIVEVYRAQEQLPPLGLVVRIVADAGRILQRAHDHQDPLGGSGAFVHGGLSDSSLLLGFDGEVRVLDFGLRKVNRFASPEAARGGVCSAKSDVFSLAAALHAALTGFEKDYAPVLAKAPSRAAFPPPSAVHPDATAELDSLLMRALFPDDKSRLSSTQELGDDLERIVGAAMPAREACATRLKQLFEERLDGFRNMVPKQTSAPAPSAPKARSSKPSLPAQPAAPVRKSGPQNKLIPTGTQPEHNPVGKRPTPPEVKAAFGDIDDMPDEHTVVVQPDDELVMAARPTGEQKKPELGASRTQPTKSERAGGSGERKAATPKKLLPGEIPDVPWESGPLARDEDDGRSGIPVDGEMAIEDVPTGAAKRNSGAFSAYSPATGGSTREEKARAKGQELVDTGEVEPDDADDLRDQPTVVKLTGSHQKLVLQPPDPDEVAAAFGDPAAADGEPLPEEPGTAIITSPSGPNAPTVPPPPSGPIPNGPPVLMPVELPAEPGTDSGLKEPDTGVLEHNKPKPPEPEPSEKKTEDAPPKKKGGGAIWALLWLLVLAMIGGFGFAFVKKPALMVKYGFKKAPPPGAEEPPAQPPPPAEAQAVEADGGVAAPALAALEDDADGGEEEEEDDDGGTVSASDGGTHGAAHHVKKKRKKGKGGKAWWQTK